MQRVLREETERHQTEVNSLQRQISQLTNDVKEGRQLTHDLETEVNTLNEELRTAKRVEDSLNGELQELRQRLSMEAEIPNTYEKSNLKTVNSNYKSQPFKIDWIQFLPNGID